MFITKQKNNFVLSITRTENAYCEVLPPVLVLDGNEVRANIQFSDIDSQKCSIENVIISDRIENLNDGIFKIKRTITNENIGSIKFKSIFEVRTAFKPTHFVFPGFNYDTSHCGVEVKAGEILSTTREGLESSINNTPTGLEKDGKPWVFAYDREGIPSASISENEEQVLALFASDENKISLESAGSIIKNTDGTFRHRIFHPISEMPLTYAKKNGFEAPLERYFTLDSNDCIELSMYIFVGEPKYKNYGTANVMEACSKIFPFDRKPELSEKEVWDLGISYFKFLQQDVNGVPMFSGRISDKLFSLMHSGELTGEAMAKALEDPENRKLTTFSKSFEIGWAGQGAMISRLLAENGFRTDSCDDVKIAEKCLDGYVSTQKENGLLYPYYGQFNLVNDKYRVPDACNMGWAMCELMRSYKLFKSHGKTKQNYYDFSVKLADFTLDSYNDSYGFPKTWHINGNPTSTEGSIGGFIIMGLCEVYSETKNKRYLDAIVKAMDFYYTRDVDNFICTAGAIDCACIDKETAYPFLESALYLYELTKENIWLERAEKAAYYFFSWMFFYDCIYDEDADFTKYNYHTTGGTLISAEHSAIDAWGALLVDGAFKLWHITKNENFKIWAKMTWWNALLAITTEKTPEIHGNKRPLGSQNEGFFHARWTKYRPTCEERGHFNDNLHAWMGAYRLYTLNKINKEDVDILWNEND